MDTITLVFGGPVSHIIKSSCMLLFSAFPLSHYISLSPTLPFQLNYIYLISCKREGKAGFPCHPAASGVGCFQGNAEYRRWPWACWGVGGGLVSMREQVAPVAFPPRLGSAGDVTPVSPVSYMTGVAFYRVSSPICWLFCVTFRVLVSSFGIFQFLCL